VPKTFGSKRGKMAGLCTRLYNEELHNLYASLYIIRVIQSKRMRWEWHVAWDVVDEKFIQNFGQKTEALMGG
jgi:hypothetical protein